MVDTQLNDGKAAAAAMRASGFTILAQGGFIEVERCAFEGAGKISAGESGLEVGSILGE